LSFSGNYSACELARNIYSLYRFSASFHDEELNGISGVTSFLITTSKGHILLDSGLPETAPLIKQNVTRLGFKLDDVKILINSHAHFDHAGGLAELKELTGAKLMATDADAALLARGGKDDFQWGDQYARLLTRLVTASM
jgi:metallo-beta-lactamase class B